MPVSTPNRNADPVSLEQFTKPGIVRQVQGLAIDFYNELNAGTILPGEPFIFCNRVCISPTAILPGKWGAAYVDWIADFVVDPDLAAAIIQAQLVYWDTDIDVVKNLDTNTVVGSVGAATDTLPTNGLLLGRAVGDPRWTTTEDGNGDLIVCTTDASRVRVVSLPGAATYYGTSGGSSS